MKNPSTFVSLGDFQQSVKEYDMDKNCPTIRTAVSKDLLANRIDQLTPHLISRSDISHLVPESGNSHAIPDSGIPAIPSTYEAPYLKDIYTHRYKDKQLCEMLSEKDKSLNLMILLLYLNDTDKPLLKRLIKLLFGININVNNVMDTGELKSILICSVMKENVDLAACLYFQDIPLNIGKRFLESLDKDFSAENETKVDQLFRKDSKIPTEIKEILDSHMYYDKEYLKANIKSNGRSRVPKSITSNYKYQFYVYKTFIHYYTEKGTHSLLHACFWYNQLLQHYKPDRTILTRLIYLVCEKTKSKHFIHMFIYFIDEFLHHNIIPDEKVFSILIKMYTKIKEFDKIDRMIELIEDSGVHLDLGYRGILLNYFLKRGDSRFISTILSIEQSLNISGLSSHLVDVYDSNPEPVSYTPQAGTSADWKSSLRDRVNEMSVVDRQRFAWILTLIIRYNPKDYYIDLYNYLEFPITIPYQISILLAKDFKTSSLNFSKPEQILYKIEMEKLVKKNDFYSFYSIYKTQQKDLNLLYLLLRIVQNNQEHIPFLINEIEKYPAPDIYVFNLLYLFDQETVFQCWKRMKRNKLMVRQGMKIQHPDMKGFSLENNIEYLINKLQY
ncbi:hypothetical protein HDV01_003480 [Terramyces sp. JEL0728]|nr:hypothetical protein HDV01_003480 [Terramyces sp. JEL0728]